MTYEDWLTERKRLEKDFLNSVPSSIVMHNARPMMFVRSVLAYREAREKHLKAHMAFWIFKDDKKYFFHEKRYLKSLRN